MYETETDLQRLEELLGRSIQRASSFLRSSFEMPEHSLSARQLADHLQGSLTVALATVTARGEPRVAPINAVFVGGRFHVPTVAEAARARHLERRPAASLTHFKGIDAAVIAHGQVQIIRAEDAEFPEIDAAQVKSGRESPREWDGHPVYLRLEPDTLYTYARHPERIGATARG